MDTDSKTAEEIDFDPEEESMLHPYVSYFLVAFVLGILVTLWTCYFLFRSTLWQVSISVSENLTDLPEAFKYYFWMFTNPLFRWIHFLVGFLFILAPRKDSALKSISIFVLSHWIRQLIRVTVREGRPLFEKNHINPRIGCSCSFGFPSGHSEGSAMLYSLAIYEVIVRNRHVSSLFKKIAIVTGVFVVLNVMVSRLYFGKHSLPQVTIGCWQGVTALTLALLFERPLDRFFKQILNGNRKAYWIAVSCFLAIIVTNAVLWYTVYEDALYNFHGFTPYRCSKCFSNNLLRIRRVTLRALQQPMTVVGLLTGIMLLLPRYSGPPESDYVKSHFSVKGLIRLIFMLACHLPLFLLSVNKYLPSYGIIAVSDFTYFVVGFCIGYLWPRLTSLCHSSFEGDIEILGESKDEKKEEAQNKDVDIEEKNSLITSQDHQTQKDGQKDVEINQGSGDLENRPLNLKKAKKSRPGGEEVLY